MLVCIFLSSVFRIENLGKHLLYIKRAIRLFEDAASRLLTISRKKSLYLHIYIILLKFKILIIITIVA